MSKTISTRRHFVKNGAVLLSGLTMSRGKILGNTPFGEKTMVKVGIIGMGSRGAGLASLVAKIKGVEIIACCDILEDHLKNGMVHAPRSAKKYTDYKALLDNKDVQAIIIATPLFLHYKMAADALAAGKHVYLEKAMSYDIPQTLDLLERVRRSGLVFQLGFQYRYYALYHKVKEIIDQNWLGKITHFECQYNRNSNWRNPVSDPKLERIINWRMYKEYCGGPLSELCAHQIDMVNYLLDSHPVKVTAAGGINYWKDGRDTYDHVRAVYEYPNGIKSTVGSMLSNAYNGYNIKIMGDKATVEIQREQAFIYTESLDNARGIVDGVTGATMKVTTQGQATAIDFMKAGEEIKEPTTYALIDFFDCIKTGRQPLSNAENGRDTTVAIHLGNKAAETETAQLWQTAYSL